MENVKQEESVPYLRNLIWVGIILALFSWTFESLIHVFFFPEGGFISEFFTRNSHELWKRFIIMGLIIGFSIYAQYIINLRRRAEAALKERDLEHTKILENNPAGIIVVDAETHKIRWTNSNALKMIGATKEAVNGQNCEKFLCPNQEHDCLRDNLDIISNQSECHLRTADGKRLPILKSVNRVKFDDSRCILETFLDLSEIKKLEYKTKIVNAELDQIFQTASVGMRVVDVDFKILRVNKALENMTGVNQKDSFGKKCSDIFGGCMCATENCSLALILKGENKVENYVEKRRPDGILIPCIVNATAFKGPDGEIVGIVESFQDISALKIAQQAIELERDKLDRILTHLSEGVCIINTDYKIEYQNSISREIIGNCNNKSCHEILRSASVPCVPCFMHEAISKGNVQYTEFTAQNERTYEYSYTPIKDIDEISKAVVMVRDVTEKNAHTYDLMRATQLSALGEMAAGVAHEINNPINGIINYAQILANKNSGNQFVEDIIKRMIKEGKRIARIVEGLLAFGQHEKPKKSLFSLENVLSDSLLITGVQMRKDDINLQTDIPADLPLIMGQAHEIQQVFINLIINAIHALNRKYPGSHVNKSLKIFADKINTNGRPYVRMSFYDQGVGIPEHLLDKVRNPFFSTSNDGKHTGLGLSISHGIINEHRGKLNIESVEGEYTCVSVELPNSQLYESENHE